MHINFNKSTSLLMIDLSYSAPRSSIASCNLSINNLMDELINELIIHEWTNFGEFYLTQGLETSFRMTIQKKL